MSQKQKNIYSEPPKPRPTMEFRNEEELNNCLKEWQTRLFLSDWIIKGCLVHGESIPELAGQSSAQWVNSCGVIKIRRANEIPDCIEKTPHELTLVHELLHFKYLLIEDDSTIEGTYYETKEHQLLEQMAKSLIMAKYNIPYAWFKNF